MSLYIVYGSETGTAEGLAAKAHADLSAKGLNPILEPADKVDPSILRAGDTIALFTCTYGDGAPPANAESLLSTLQSGYNLSGIKYAVFGIGSSSFPAFCQTAADFEYALESCGAKRIMDTVKSDDGNYDSDYSSWVSAFSA